MFQPQGDRRQLGLVYYWVTARTGPGPNLPAPWPAAALLLSGVLVYAALRAVTRQSGPAFAGVVIWGLLIGAVNAANRPWLVFYSWYWIVPPLVVLLLVPWGRSIAARRAGRGPVALPLASDRPLTTAPNRTAVAIVGAALIVLVWHLIAPLIPTGTGPTDNLTWGVAFYGLLPWPVQVLGVAVVLGALLWAWSGWGVQAPSAALAERPFRLPSLPSGPWQWWALIGAGLLVFGLFPVQYSEGDSQEFDAKIPKGAIWRERELLDFYLQARLWQALRWLFPLPSQIYIIVATLAGGVYLGGAALLGRALGRTRREAWAIVAGLIAVANILLYFGYVESYALVQVASLFVLWTCWQYTQGRLPFGAVGAAATLAPLFHGSALWWGPMVVAAWLLRARTLPAAVRWRTALREGAEGVAVGVVIMAIMISVALIDGYNTVRLQQGLGEMGGADGHTMMQLFTPSTPYEHYVYFSWAHLGAVIQEQLLTAPLALLTIVLMGMLAWPGVRRLAAAVPGFVTLAVGAASMFFYSTAWNPDLGPRNDWDLLSLPALPMTLLAVFLLLRLPPGRARRLALTAYLSVSAIHAAAWVLVHVLGLGHVDLSGGSGS
jgi:hypothetical protein